MKKLLQLLAVPLAALAFVTVSSATVAAQEANDCTDIVISNTGAGSVNEVNCNGSYTVTIDCENNTQIVLDVEQDGTSGTATVNDNTNAGGAQSGDVVNTSDIDAYVENTNCFAEETPETPETPEEETPEVKAASTVAELPNTGGTSGLQIVTIAAGAVLALVIISRVALGLHSRSLK